jgi:hypothetical protein
VKNAEYVRRFDSSDWPLLRQISHGDDEIGFALIGSETSTGSARCAWAATVLSVAASAEREGAAGRFSGKLSTTEEQPANRTQSNIIRSIKTHPGGKVQAAAFRSNQTQLMCPPRFMPGGPIRLNRAAFPDSPQKPDSPAGFLEPCRGHPAYGADGASCLQPRVCTALVLVGAVDVHTYTRSESVAASPAVVHTPGGGPKLQSPDPPHCALAAAKVRGVCGASARWPL